MYRSANAAGPLVVRFSFFALFGAYLGAVAFGVLAIGLVRLVWGEAGAVAVLLALAVPLAGFTSIMLLAAAIHRSRNPYLVVDIEAGKITAVRAGRRHHTYQLGSGERFAIEYGEAGSGESFVSGDRIVLIRPDGCRSPTDLWGKLAHRDDWATLARILRGSSPSSGHRHQV